MTKQEQIDELIGLYAMRTAMNNYQDRGEELLRLFLKEYEQVKKARQQVKSVGLANVVVGQSEQFVCPTCGLDGFGDLEIHLEDCDD